MSESLDRYLKEFKEKIKELESSTRVYVPLRFNDLRDMNHW